MVHIAGVALLCKLALHAVCVGTATLIRVPDLVLHAPLHTRSCDSLQLARFSLPLVSLLYVRIPRTPPVFAASRSMLTCACWEHTATSDNSRSAQSHVDWNKSALLAGLPLLCSIMMTLSPTSVLAAHVVATQ
jgi:hypothetical protein